MTTAISLQRVSTSKQGVSGLGLEAQQQTIAAFAAREGISILSQFVEVESGASTSRKVLREALDECVRTGSILLVAKMDRFARSLATMNLLDDYGVELVAADLGMGCSQLVKNLVCLISVEERRLASVRTKAALKVCKENGVALGNPRWEESIDKAREAANEANRQKGDKSFWKVLPHLMKAYFEGARSLADYAAKLNEAGSRTPRGKEWSRVGVRRFLRRAQTENFIPA